MGMCKVEIAKSSNRQITKSVRRLTLAAAHQGQAVAARMITLFLFAIVTTVQAAEWPYWRGPEQTGASREKAVVTSWSPEGENLIWKSDVGGRTTPIVMNGEMFVIAPVGEGIGLQERVVALDAETGRIVWEHRFNVFDTDVVENRVGWSALAGDPETGNVYAHATGGEFFCFSRDGQLKWKVSMTEMFGRISGYGGRIHTPIIDEERVIISFLSSGWGDHGRPLHRYAVFDKRTGDLLAWFAPGGAPLDTTYSTPVVAVIDGVRMLIAANADGAVYGMKARTGEVLWSFKLSKRGLNSSLVVDGNYVYASHSEENITGTSMGRVVCIDARKRGDITETGEVWRYDACEVGYASPAIANGRLYVVTNAATLHCLDAKTGRHIWEHNLGRVGKGSPTVTADGVIYVGEQTGIFHILKDEGDKCVSLDVETFTRPDRAIDEIFGSPAVVGGRVYLMTRYHTYCLGVRGKTVESPPVPVMPAEKPSAGSGGKLDERKLFLQMVPAEVTLAPGESRRFDVRAFDESGLPIGEFRSLMSDTGLTPSWTLTFLSGTIEGDGTITAASPNTFSAGTVKFKLGDKESTGRVRVSPRVPFEETFESIVEGAVPPGWLSVQRKTKVVTRDGSKVLQKLAEDPAPPFMKIKTYMTPPIAGGYTMEADLLGTPKGEMFKPDMGLVNSRYELTLLGGNQALRLESWTPIPRLREDVPFPWQTDRWYRMKFEVRLQGGKALLRGKVWPRDSQEPGAWTIEAEDPFPNFEGSPGLFGYSPGTTTKSKGPEVFFDNVRVVPNE
jgi:outer membrane protein assembly factor BamB